ncbi:SigE family RNA polymerase sigma factor [Bailinhaonella thermotolerans]|uniref:SigE family RNA polymerase sigma factor n=1 Tax=Bailinhaonella thermotolerans TaxID=1070861 RepID=A0A3A4AP23_9ACTN|nr:SigE family RNA polymerase sigma factor [Bailinhaonella thermotolerans]RJL30761.1 SigE family RNA polymerase sigma factor [Bailinhaonella thermotolerans]
MKRDEDSFAEFVASRGTALLRTAYLTCGSRDEAEDVLQTALERAYRSWARIESGADPEPYVRRIVVNTAISRARRRAILRILPTATPPDRPAYDGAPSLELRDELMRALRALTPKQRAVLVLRYFEDLTEAQTAEALGVTVGTVKSQASRALARLRTLIEPHGTDLREVSHGAGA